MYHGEVNVAQEELNSFLAVAEDLKIKGLTQNNKEESSKHKSNSFKRNNVQTSSNVNKEFIQQQKRPRVSEQITTPIEPDHSSTVYTPVMEDQDIQEVVPIKTEPVNTVNEARFTSPVVPSKSAPVARDIPAPRNDAVVTYSEDYTGYDDQYDEQMQDDQTNQLSMNQTQGNVYLYIKKRSVCVFVCLRNY